MLAHVGDQVVSRKFRRMALVGAAAGVMAFNQGAEELLDRALDSPWYRPNHSKTAHVKRVNSNPNHVRADGAAAHLTHERAATMPPIVRRFTV